MRGLTTGVFDTVEIGPAEGVVVALCRVDSSRQLISDSVTLVDRKLEAQLLPADDFSTSLVEPEDLQFGLADDVLNYRRQNYHLSLLASPSSCWVS